MAANQGAAPIIIKKIKKGGHGHHGGAWKVALADFVTAMMAFFMLMWLLGSTTDEQRVAVSAYFNDPLATTGLSGNGAGNPALTGGSGILEGQGENPFTSQSTNQDNTTTSGPTEEEQEDADRLDRARMIKMMDELKEVVDAGKGLKDYADQVLFDITPEGLRIQIVDKENRAMFDQGSAHLQDYTADILHEIVKVISEAPNRISVSGHTDATPYSMDDDYGNWELSADRANAARRELLVGGLPEEKIGRVVGLGSSDLLDPSQPRAPINRRISIVVLRGDFGKAVGMDGAESGGADTPVQAPTTGDAAVEAPVEAAAEETAAADKTANAASPAADAKETTAPATPATSAPGVAPTPAAAAADAVAAAAAIAPAPKAIQSAAKKLKQPAAVKPNKPASKTKQ